MEKIILPNNKEFILVEVIYENVQAQTRVLKVKDSGLDREVILKQIGFEDEQQRKLILREVKTQVYLAAYTEYIPQIHNVFENLKGRQITIEMSLIKGTSLREFMKVQAGLPKDGNWYQEQMDRFMWVAETMSRIHRLKNFVHKDLKPENIILNDRRRAAYIIDFGISGPGLSKGIGTREYMAPEQQMRVQNLHASQATDVYALGQIGIEMFSGSVLQYGKDLIFNPSSGKWLKEKDISNIGGEVYPRLGAVLKKAIAMDPDDRYVNANDLREALKNGRKKHGGKH